MVVGRRRGEAAVVAVRVANVVVAHIVVVQLFMALGTNAGVVDEVYAVVLVGRQAIDRKVGAGVAVAQLRANEVVGVKDHVGGCRQGFLDVVEDELGVGVAVDRVAEEVGAHHVGGLQARVDELRAALVDLKDGQVELGLAADGRAVCQRGHDTRVDIGAGAVVEHLVAVFLQHIQDHVAGSGLAVGAGDADHGLGLLDVAHKIGADLEGDLAGEEARLAAQGVEQGRGGLGAHKGHVESKVTGQCAFSSKDSSR